MKRKKFLLVFGAVVSALFLFSSSTALNIHQTTNSENSNNKTNQINKKIEENNADENKEKSMCPLCNREASVNPGPMFCFFYGLILISLIIPILVSTLIGIPTAMQLMDDYQDVCGEYVEP